MNCCDSLTQKERIEFVCPKCTQKGSSVDIVTLRSLLHDKVQMNIIESAHYKYCKTSNCDVSYFSQNNYFEVEDLKVKATHKDQSMDVSICYCFGHTRKSIFNDIKTNGETSALEDIKKKMKDPGCFCERSNPQGNCCLGNVAAWINQVKTNQF